MTRLDVVQHVATGAVPEREVRHFDRTIGGEIHRAGSLEDRRLLVEQPEQLVQRGAGLLHDVVLLAELLDGLEQAVEVEHEGGDGADADDALVGEEPTEPDDDRGGRDPERLHEREVAGGDPDRLHVRFVLRLVRGTEPTGERLLPTEGLHDPHARQTLLQRRQVGADALANVEVGAVRLTPEPARREHGRRHDDERAERELPAQDEDHDDRPEEHQHVHRHRGEPGLHELLQRVDVGRHARDEAPGLLTLEEVEPEVEQVPEDTRGDRAGRSRRCARSG